MAAQDDVWFVLTTQVSGKRNTTAFSTQAKAQEYALSFFTTDIARRKDSWVSITMLGERVETGDTNPSAGTVTHVQLTNNHLVVMNHEKQ
jgi:hypothetical protein